ncbi:hypothetical protein TNCV_647141 [Trichonephila clavipes]|uniref:Uncharacterized protein n=1 Tax=Trichonephila clavipes TaxID=2585209 RepID=A0A8X6SNP8_TRICX|nr:hypothetical protein TNCV_647141 [Trichonephila clavipes]
MREAILGLYEREITKPNPGRSDKFDGEGIGVVWCEESLTGRSSSDSRLDSHPESSCASDDYNQVVLFLKSWSEMSSLGLRFGDIKDSRYRRGIDTHSIYHVSKSSSWLDEKDWR